MKTISIKLYKFDELSQQAQENAVRKLWDVNDSAHIYDDAHETVKQFHKYFPTKEGRNSWLDVRTSHIDDCILSLTGIRLRTYLINNFYNALYRRKYFTLLDGNRRHRMAVNYTPKNGGIYSQIFSTIQYVQGNCPLTGVCYDDDILNPFYDFINNPDSRTFEDLVNEGFDNLKRSIESECEYLSSAQAIIETIHANDYDFTEDGKLY